ncbi:DUF1643 domain-containing protein [Micromonospora haikouensis]|uniref:DUF1643 domain-containing protein n=1 Tax=Micromonospora haikouensis TaxID=686309 RepID=UPI003D71BDEA
MTTLVVDQNTPALGETAVAVFEPAQPCPAHPDTPSTACAGCHPYRYDLTRTWSPGTAEATFVMLNPSTADAFHLDPTVRRCVGYARAWGCGGVRLLNLFGLRSTDPTALRRHDDPVGPHNDAVLTTFFADQAGTRHGPVVAAWGAYGDHLDRASTVAALARQHRAPLHALAITRAGHPGHPLYLPKTAQLVPYEL